MLLAAAMFHGAYVARAAWFGEHGNSSSITLLGLLAALGTSSLVAEACLPPRVRRPIRIKLKLTIIGFAWLAMIALWFTGGPSVTGIQDSLARGDLMTARQEADAIQAIHASSDDISDVLQLLAMREQEAERVRRHSADERHLQQVTQAPTLAEAVHSVSASWWSQDLARQARAAVIARASAEVELHYQKNSSAPLAQIATLIASVDESTAARAKSLSLLARTSECVGQEDFACAITVLDTWKQQFAEDRLATPAYETVRNKTEAELHQWLVLTSLVQPDPEARKLALEQTITNATLYEDFSGKRAPRPLHGLRAQLARTEQLIDKERRRAALAEQRRKAAEDRDARRQAAAERRQQRRYTPLLCRDGTFSPSCTCGGSWQGCCSHHGGVAGCSE